MADFLGQVEQVGLEHCRRPGKLCAQLRALGRDAHRAGVEMTGAHHDAALGEKRRGSNAELVGAKQRGDDDVPARLDPAIHAQTNAASKPISAQRLLGFRETDLPRDPCVLDRRQWAGAGSAVAAGDVHDVRQALDDAGRDRADAALGDQLDRNRRQRVHLFQVVDQLRQVLDGIDVMVRRRRDQGDP